MYIHVYNFGRDAENGVPAYSLHIQSLIKNSNIRGVHCYYIHTYLNTLMHSMRLAEPAKTHASDSVDRSLDFSVR